MEKKRIFQKIFYGTLLLTILLIPLPALAIDNSPEWANLDFDFSSPGARARGMGSAFVSLSDDASSAITNPAGLAQLPRMQFYIEGKSSNYESESSTSSLDAFLPDNEVDAKIDRDTDNFTNVSFAAFSTPLFNDKLNISIFYNSKASMENNIDVRRFVLGSDGFSQMLSSSDIALDEYGLSLAKSFLNKKLMLGIGFSVMHFSLEGENFQFLIDDDPVFPDDISRTETHSSGSSAKLAYRAGILFHPLEKLSIGASYNLMPKFDYRFESATLLSCHELDNDGNCIGDYRYRINEFGRIFSVPDSFAVGASFHIMPQWIILVEGKYIKYSDLMDDFEIAWLYPPPLNDEDSDYDIDNIWEFHVGTEYVLSVKEAPLALRVGTYHEPAHSLEYVGDNKGTEQEIMFDGGEDVWHFTAGIGTVIKNRVQIDFAADIDKNDREYILSLVYQF